MAVRPGWPRTVKPQPSSENPSGHLALAAQQQNTQSAKGHKAQRRRFGDSRGLDNLNPGEPIIKARHPGTRIPLESSHQVLCGACQAGKFHVVVAGNVAAGSHIAEINCRCIGIGNGAAAAAPVNRPCPCVLVDYLARIAAPIACVYVDIIGRVGNAGQIGLYAVVSRCVRAAATNTVGRLQMVGIQIIEARICTAVSAAARDIVR